MMEKYFTLAAVGAVVIALASTCPVVAQTQIVPAMAGKAAADPAVAEIEVLIRNLARDFTDFPRGADRSSVL